MAVGSSRSSPGSHRGRWRVPEPEGAAGRKLKAANAQSSKSESSSPGSDRGRWRVFEPEGVRSPRPLFAQTPPSRVRIPSCSSPLHPPILMQNRRFLAFRRLGMRLRRRREEQNLSREDRASAREECASAREERASAREERASAGEERASAREDRASAWEQCSSAGEDRPSAAGEPERDARPLSRALGPAPRPR